MRFAVLVFFCLQAALLANARPDGYSYEQPSVPFSIPARGGFEANAEEHAAADEHIEPTIPAQENIRTEVAAPEQIETEVQEAEVPVSEVAESEKVEAIQTVVETSDVKPAPEISVRIGDEVAQEHIEAPIPAQDNKEIEVPVQAHIESEVPATNTRIPVGNRLAEALKVSESDNVDATANVAKASDVIEINDRSATKVVESKGYDYKPPSIRFEPPTEVEKSVVHQELGSRVKSHRSGPVKRLKLGGSIAVSSNKVEVPKPTVEETVAPVETRREVVVAPVPTTPEGYFYEPPKVSFDPIEDNFVHQELGSEVKAKQRGSGKRLKPCRNRDINEVLAERALKRPQERRQTQYAETLSDEGYFQQEVSLDV